MAPEPGGHTTVGTPDGLTVAGNLAVWSDGFGNQVLATEFGPTEKARARRAAPRFGLRKLACAFGPIHTTAPNRIPHPYFRPRSVGEKGASKLAHSKGRGAPNQAPQRRLSKSYVYGPGGLLAVVENGEIQYITADHLGSPRVITNQQGEVVSRRDLKPYGEDIPVGVGGRNAFDGYGEQDGIRQRFAAGYERDDETGLDFAQARYYASTMGRFMSADPLTASGRRVNPQTWNRYTYCIDNPLRFVDPLGLRSDPANQPKQPVQGPDGVWDIPDVIDGGTATATNPDNAEGWDVVMPLVRGVGGGLKKTVVGLGESVVNHVTDPLSVITAGASTGIEGLVELGAAGLEIAEDPDAFIEAVVDSANTVGAAGVIEAGADAVTQALAGELISAGAMRANFRGMEVRGVRDLSHLSDSTLNEMVKQGFAARNRFRQPLQLHHLGQNPAGPIVEMPRRFHNVGNRVQHPLGSQKGAGLTKAQRQAFDQWRNGYWKARAAQEIERRKR